jgi:hypothetical protein
VLYNAENPVTGNDGIYDLNISHLTPGMYIIEMQAGGERTTSRFVKE